LCSPTARTFSTAKALTSSADSIKPADWQATDEADMDAPDAIADSGPA
jgi:hypothetical protein